MSECLPVSHSLSLSLPVPARHRSAPLFRPPTCRWDVKVFGFDKDGDAQEAALAGDMARLRGEKAIVLRVVFPSMYPAQPPYLRVIRPRFQFRTGHVTVGGSICIESLTQSGWSMSMTFESVILTVRQNMIAGGGRLDLHNRADYDAREAKVAFDRLKRVHGWL